LFFDSYSGEPHSVSSVTSGTLNVSFPPKSKVGQFIESLKDIGRLVD